MGLIFAVTAILVSPGFVSPVLAVTCPAPLAQAKRLVLVATQSMDTALATLQRFTRRSADLPWKRVGAAEPAVVGKAGLGWGFPFLDVKAGETVCVEDPSSPLYNTITKRSDIGSVEADDMRSSPFYRSGLFVDYPSDRATRRGSCILIHIWSAPDRGTAGCVGLPEARVEALQDFSRAGAVIAILPATAFDRFPGCLPAPTVRPATFTGGTR
jgi:hypothetical protein